MKSNKGFTLVELLAVIAILAILVLIALPNTIEMFKEAKKNSFLTECKQIYKTAQNQWMSDSMFDTNEQIYSRCDSCSGKSLKLSGRNQIDYYVKVNKAGKISEFYVTDNTFQYKYNEGNLLITDITEAEEISNIRNEDNILIISGSGVYLGEIPKLITVLEQKEEGVLSVGDEISIANKEGFYVIESNENQTVLLAKYNLYVGYITSFSNEIGYSIVRKIESNESGYGWQSQLTTTEKTGVVAFSGTNYWQSTTNPYYFNDQYPDARNQSVYNPNLRGELIPEATKPSSQTFYKAKENDYGIALYVEDYISKVRSLGVDVIDGGLLSNNQASSLGCSGNSTCSNYSNPWLKNTSFWVASVAWEGSANYQSCIKTIGKNGAYSYTGYNDVSNYGVRPTITVNTSDIEQKDHQYFENKPEITIY